MSNALSTLNVMHLNFSRIDLIKGHLASLFAKICLRAYIYIYSRVRNKRTHPLITVLEKSTEDILIPDPLSIIFEASLSRYLRTHDFDFVYKFEANCLEESVLKDHNLKTLTTI